MCLQDIETIKSPKLLRVLGGITADTLDKWIENDAFPRPIRRGRDRHWFVSEVREWLKKQPRVGAEEQAAA